MFGNRNNAQKPDEELIRRFQQAFPHVGRRRSSTIAPESGAVDTGASDPTNPSEVEDVIGFENKSTLDHDMELFSNWTPRHLQLLASSPWRDSGAMSMVSASQHFGFSTPSSCRMDTVLNSWAGDLHTPTLGVDMITPQSFANVSPANLRNIHGSDLETYYPRLFGQPIPNLYSHAQQTANTPSPFMRCDLDNGTMRGSVDGVSLDKMQLDFTQNATDPTDFPNKMGISCAKGGNFRYHVSLQAQTAIKHARENPVTYLNKGQPYVLTVIDSTPPIIDNDPIKYRTFIRISFEGEEERSHPAQCWKKWVEGRGKNELYQRGGELLAVEYVDPVEGSDEDGRAAQVELQQKLLDGFDVIWSASPCSSTSSCSISVRFNFLSTDFSHSKGVKGIPVRLCVKTELLALKVDIGVESEPELCDCIVKLFRDHGAERKFYNDMENAKKTIEKLKHQIAEAERGIASAKRKRGTIDSSRCIDSKHKKPHSMLSGDFTSKYKTSKDDLQTKLSRMQQNLLSTRLVSILGLRGDEGDDPDSHPIRLLNNGDYTKGETPSSQISHALNIAPSGCEDPPNLALMHYAQVPKPSIEAADIDQSYRMSLEHPPTPIACFYLKFAGEEIQPQTYYHAIYLRERTIQDLINQISAKLQLSPNRVSRILHTNKSGLRIIVDDSFVHKIPEGQDMVAHICGAESAKCHNASHSGSPLEIDLIY